MSDDITRTRRTWWRERWPRYNAVLAASGAVTFVMHAIPVFCLVYALYALVATALYWLGPGLEWALRLRRPERYRTIAFRAGCFLAATVAPTWTVVVVLGGYRW